MLQPLQNSLGRPDGGPATDALPSGTRRALLVLAASGTGHVDEVGGALAHLDLRIRDLAPAVAAGIVETTAAGWRFPDPDLGRRFYEAASPIARRTVHAALVSSLRDLRMAEDGELLAVHLAGAAASTDEAAADALGKAADGARSRGALDTARQYYLRAAHLAPDSRSRAIWLAGAADTSRLLGDLAGVGRAIREARMLTDDYGLVGRIDRIAAMSSVLRTVQPGLDCLLEPGPAYDAFDLVRQGRTVEAKALLAKTVPEAVRADPLEYSPLTLPALAATMLWTGVPGPAAALLDRSIALVTAYGAIEHLPTLLITRTESLFRRGEWLAARADAEQAVGLAGRLGQNPVRTVAHGLLFRISSLMGDPVDAEELGTDPYSLWPRHALGVAHTAAGDWHAAATTLSQVADGLEQLGIHEPSILPVAGDLVEAQLRIGDLVEAITTARAAHKLAAGSASTVARAVALRCLGQVGEPQARQNFETALRLHRATDDRFEEARTLFAFARAERTKSLARMCLDQAAERFAALGARPWLQQVENEQRRTTDHPCPA